MGVPPNHPSHDHFSLETCNLGDTHILGNLHIDISLLIYPLVNLQKTMEDHIFQWENSLFLRPFSVAILT